MRSRDNATRRARTRLALSLLRAQRRTVVLAVLTSFGYLACTLSVPWITRWAVDDVLLAGRDDRLRMIVIALLVTALGRAYFSATRRIEAAKLLAGVGADLRDRVYGSLQRLSFGDHVRYGAGALLTRASSDATLVENIVGALPFTVQSSLLAVLGTGVLFTMSPLLAAGVVAALLLLGTHAVRMARPLHTLSMTVQERNDVYTQFVDQQVRGVRVVKGHGLEALGEARADELAQGIRQAGLAFNRRRGRFWATFSTVPGAATVLVVGIGGWLAASGRLSPGDLLVFLQYVGLLVAPVMVTAQLLSMWPMAAAALDRIAELLDNEPLVVDRPGAGELDPAPQTLRFEDVWFGFTPDSPVLCGVDLEVEAGTSLAVVGAAGSGKTTLTSLVGRFHDVERGRVTIGDVDIRDVTLASLRAAVAYVFEDTVVFSASIVENVVLGNPKASPERIERAVALAGVAEFLDAMPDGDTVLEEGGSNVSGGQRQRIALARAFLRDAGMLVLDDPASALDPGLARHVHEALVEVMRGRTTLLIARRLETVVLADRVALLDEGRIVAVGTHEELLALPAYRQALGLESPSASTSAVAS